VTTRSNAPLDHLAVWVAAQTTGLASLAPDLPSAAGAAIAHSLEVLTNVSTRTDGLQAALSCASGPAVGPADTLGPVPAPCVPAATDPAPQSGAGIPGSTGSTALPAPSGLPSPPTVGRTDSGGGTSTLPGGVPVPTPDAPTTPPLSVPDIPGTVTSAVPGLPRLTPPGAGSRPLLDVPSGTVPLDACLPPLATVGNC
jgi:hypothetical protein